MGSRDVRVLSPTVQLSNSGWWEGGDVRVQYSDQYMQYCVLCLAAISYMTGSHLSWATLGRFSLERRILIKEWLSFMRENEFDSFEINVAFTSIHYE